MNETRNVSPPSTGHTSVEDEFPPLPTCISDKSTSGEWVPEWAPEDAPSSPDKVSKPSLYVPPSEMISRLRTDLHAARMSAVSNRTTVTFTVSADPENRYSFHDGRGVEHDVELPKGVRVVSATPTISFQPNGSVLGGATIVIESANADRWSVITSSVGMSRVERVKP